MTYPRVTPVLHRLRVKPDEPAYGPPAVDGPRRPGIRRIHDDMTVARVRHLVETTGMSYREIAQKVGIPHSNITGWKRDFGWQRPNHAPRHKDMVPTARAGRRLKLRRLAGELRALAERAVREQKQAPRIDLGALMRALQLLKMARFEAKDRPRKDRRRPPATTASDARTRNAVIRAALESMQRDGIDLDAVPRDALDLVIDAYTPVEDHMMLQERGRKR